MKIRFILAALVAASFALASESAYANTVYHLDLTGGGASAIGTITTDSTIGTLSAPNILDWQILLTTGVQTFSLNGPSNSEYFVEGAGLTATATGLFFNFGAADQSALIFENPVVGSGINFLCFNDTQGACSLDPSLVAVRTTGASTTFSIGSGVQQIASVAATPLPAALPLFASAIGGLGFVGWRRRRAG